MDRYEKENAAHRIEGYFLPRPFENNKDAFHRAKAETVRNLQKGIQAVHELSFDSFMSLRIRF